MTASIRSANSISPAESSRQRSDIQALRAIAVALVVLFHVWPARLPGGYIGVDVFFVISGFLISTNLYKELDRTGRIALLSFYSRRARRLLPASSVVLIAVGIATCLVVPQTLWGDIGSQLVGSTLYVQNWVLAHDAVDYLALNADASPLQHFWSLSVEEQFYLAWPALLLLCSACRSGRRIKVVAITAGLVTLLSFGYNIAATWTGPEAYFSTAVRVWELMLGAIVGLVARYVAVPSGPRTTSTILRGVGLIMILGSAVVVSTDSQFPGYIGLVPTVGTCLVIYAGILPGSDLALRLMKVRAVQFLGDISYSVYLWHWPIIVLGPAIIGGYGYIVSGLVGKLALVGVALLLGWASKVLVEDKFRPQNYRPMSNSQNARTESPLPRSNIPTALLLIIAVFATVGVGSTFYLIANQRIHEADQSLDTFLASGVPCSVATMMSSGNDNCWRPSSNPRTVYPDPIIASRDSPHQACQQTATRPEIVTCQLGETSASYKVLVVGDSHATQWLSPLDEIGRARGWHIQTLLKSGCAFGSRTGWNSSCQEWNENVAEYVVHERVQLVITSGQGFAGLATDTRDQYRKAVDGIAKSWSLVTSKNVPVVAIADNPWPRLGGVLDPPSCVDDNPVAECSFGRVDAMTIDPQVEASKQNRLAHLIDMNSEVCPQQDRCNVAESRILKYRDGEHLTDVYARSLVVKLDAALNSAIPDGGR